MHFFKFVSLISCLLAIPSPISPNIETAAKALARKMRVDDSVTSGFRFPINRPPPSEIPSTNGMSVADAVRVIQPGHVARIQQMGII